MKELIIWSEGYSVNHTEIDKQHKKLINLINKLYNLYLDKDTARVFEVIKEIEAYTIYHFETEEKLFIKHNYPQQYEHIEKHNEFKTELNDIIKKFQSSNNILTMKIMTFLQRWLTNHILKEDKKYCSYI